MEFNEKLAELRQKKGLTQEELAAALFVSRTAVSKWESGRGYPNIESLKAIAKFFSVTVDELLSGDELLSIAEEDKGRVKSHYKKLIFALSDIAASLLFFLPFFGEKSAETVRAVSLLSLCSVSFYLKISYFVSVIALLFWGILMLIAESKAYFNKISIVLSLIGIFLFTVSLEPYAAVFLFAFLILKVIMSRKVS